MPNTSKIERPMDPAMQEKLDADTRGYLMSLPEDLRKEYVTNAMNALQSASSYSRDLDTQARAVIAGGTDAEAKAVYDMVATKFADSATKAMEWYQQRVEKQAA